MKQYLLSAWSMVDPIYYHCTRLKYVLDDNQQKTLFRVRLTRYKGNSVALSDDTVINKNDLLVKIHLHNVRLLRDIYNIKSDMRRAVYIYHMIKRALPRLTQYVQTHQKAHHIKGIVGITSLYRGSERLGFEVLPIKSPVYRIFKTVTCTLINTLANNRMRDEPVYLFMSKQQLAKKYAPSSILNS